MTLVSTLENEIAKQIALLAGTQLRLTLMSVAVPGMDRSLLQTAVRRAAEPFDAIGPLADGSIGVISRRNVGPDGGAGVEDRFLPRAQATFLTIGGRAVEAPQCFWFRAVHRWAIELTSAGRLVDALFGMPSRPIGVATPIAKSRPYQPDARKAV